MPIDSIQSSDVRSVGPDDGFTGGRHREASPIAYVDAGDPPVLLIHGDADAVVPVTQSDIPLAR